MHRRATESECGQTTDIRSTPFMIDVYLRRLAMTVQQEAIRMINNMPDETVTVLVELLKRMTMEDGYSADRQVEGSMQIRPSKRRLGIADGMYKIPDDIDACNDEIARMFGVAE